MKTRKILFYMGLAFILFVSAMIFACGDDDDDDNDNDAGDDDTGGETDDDDSGASCTQDRLCSQAIVCGFYEGTQEDCVADSEQYVDHCGDSWDDLFACECECYATETDCTDYYNCGATCWETYCP